MTPDRFRLLEELYDAAAVLPAPERTRFIEERCAGDDDLRRELLAAFRDEPSGLTGVIEQAAASETEEAWAGRRMGPYRIVRPLGRGGMGAVYLAVRDDDQFHKEVALKTLKFELEGGPAVARFRHERQILAHLEHPNIARLLDGGASDHGTPYLVLEYVAGVPIDVWCEKQQLSIEQRLHLFRDVCDAVQYAHQHLIVHRDLKPGNILVTAGGVPKLLDFGIAKLLDASPVTGAQPLTATATGLLLMTPDYASPEQVRGEAVSTATDVYSLGAVLYQLLTGQRPYAFQNYDPVEIARVVCETEARPPSALGNRRLRGDLDVIVLKAMQKEPARRYASVVELSEDIRRHLEGLPIAARADTTVYRAVKFVRRNRLSVAAVAAVLIALAIGLAVALQQARIAQRRFAQVRELANTFLFQFYDQVTPLPGSTQVRANIVETARKYLDGLSREAGSDKGLLLELAQAYERLGAVQGRTGAINLGQVEEARKSYQRALDLYERMGLTPASPPELRRKAAGVWSDLARLEADANHDDRAEADTRRMLALLADRVPDPETRILRAAGERTLSDLRLRQGHTTEALALIESSLRALLELRASGYPLANFAEEISNSQQRVARARVATGDLDGAVSAYEELLRNSPTCEERGPTSRECRNRAVRLAWLADVYGAGDRPNLGELGKAAALYQQSLDIDDRAAALDPNNRQARFNLATGSGKLGDVVWQADSKRALALYERALATAKALVSKEQLRDVRNSYLTAITRPLVQLGRLAEARKAFDTAVKEEGWTKATDPYSDRVQELSGRLIEPRILWGEKRTAEAHAKLQEIIRIASGLHAERPEDLAPVFFLSQSYRMLASMSSGPERRQALLASAAAWHAWPATSFTRREEQKDLAAARP